MVDFLTFRSRLDKGLAGKGFAGCPQKLETWIGNFFGYRHFWKEYFTILLYD